MKDLLIQFESKKPEIVFEWHDSETDAEGWVVINSTRGGAAGGGTRMRKGLNKKEVESLAKTMEIKFSISGPQIGGAKSGINFDPSDPRKSEVLKRWYTAIKPLLKYYYGTGGDLNISETNEVIPITEENGIWHPQEGIFTGHFQPTAAQTVNRIGQLRFGVIKVVEDPMYSPDVRKRYTVAELITGYGVSEAVRHYYNLWGGDFTKKKAIIQGWGNVGAAAAFFLAQLGVKIVGIIDLSGGLIKEEGFTFEEITKLFVNRTGNQLSSDELIPFDTINEAIWKVKAEVFVPAATSRIVTQGQVGNMIARGLEVISCGANVPFSDEETFYGPVSEYADQRVALIPDFIASCGMARVFAYLMSGEVNMSDENIFHDTSDTIKKALEKIRQRNSSKTKLTNTAYDYALKLLMN